MSDDIIQINNMNKWFGDFQVLKNISLDVEANKKIVVCGPSGSGKSTLIRCINRLEEHQEGTIIVDGNELSENTKDIESIRAPKELNEDVIKFISKIKKEPKWMLEWRLKAFNRLKSLKEPNWQKPKYPKINYQDLYYYSAPKSTTTQPKSLDEVDPKLIETYKKLGIPLQEQKRLNGIAVDAVFDSVSVATTFKGELTKKGIIFCSISEAIRNHPDLVKKYLGSVIPITDHYFATLNSAVFTDGSLFIFQKELSVLWNYQLILESMHPKQVSLNVL